MRTVAEIEAALEQLPAEQMLAVAAWLYERCSMLDASEMMFQQLEKSDGSDGGMQWRGEGYGARESLESNEWQIFYS